MEKLTLEDFRLAIGKLGEDDFTKDGAPKMAAINSALEAAGFDAITSEERDELMASMTEPQLEDPDPGMIEVTITRSMADPLPLYVHGVGHFTLRVGETYTLPADAVEALRNTDTHFTITETDNG